MKTSKRMTLREARRRAGLTQEALAARVAVKQTALSRLECGVNQQPLFYLGLAIAKALDVDPYQLQFGGESR